MHRRTQAARWRLLTGALATAAIVATVPGPASAGSAGTEPAGRAALGGTPVGRPAGVATLSRPDPADWTRLDTAAAGWSRDRRRAWEATRLAVREAASQAARQAARQAAQSPPCRPVPLEARAAGVLVVGLPDITSPTAALVGELRRLGVGGIVLRRTNIAGPEQVRTLVATLRADRSTPLLVSVDQELGRVSAFRALLGPLPSARRLALGGDAGRTRQLARTVGATLAAHDMDLALSPVVDLDDGPAGGVIGDRSFSAEPARAAEHAAAWALGLREAGVLPAAKHFPGHGRSPVDSHLRLASVPTTLSELSASDLVPFVAQIRAGTPVIMLDHVVYQALDPHLPASLSPAAYRLLRQLGFRGVAMTDSLDMGAVNLHWEHPRAAVLAVTAGADALLATDGRQATRMRDALVDAVRSGRLAEARLDEAVARMLALQGADPRPVLCRAG